MFVDDSDDEINNDDRDDDIDGEWEWVLGRQLPDDVMGRLVAKSPRPEGGAAGLDIITNHFPSIIVCVFIKFNFLVPPKFVIDVEPIGHY